MREDADKAESGRPADALLTECALMRVADGAAVLFSKKKVGEKIFPQKKSERKNIFFKGLVALNFF